MRTPFLPKKFIPPETSRINNMMFVEPISVKHNEEDQKAFTQNAEIILKTRGTRSKIGWPFLFFP